MNNDELMVMFLIHNQQYIQKLIEPYTAQYNELLSLEEPIFIGDIQKQYLDLVKWIIVKELTSRTQATAEDAFILLENFNVEEYIRV